MFSARTPALITLAFAMAAGLAWAGPAAAESATVAERPALTLRTPTQGAVAAAPIARATNAGSGEIVVGSTHSDGAVAGRTGADPYASVLSVDDTGLRVERADVLAGQAHAGCVCDGNAVSGRVERGKGVPRQKTVKGKTRPSP